MAEVYIVGASRTAIGSFQGQFYETSAVQLGATVIEDVLRRAKVAPEDVSQVIMGQVLTAGQGQNPARQASIKAKIPIDVPAYTINMLCGSGLKTIFLGYQGIRNEDFEIAVCGGQENMSRAQHCAFIRNGVKLGTAALEDSLLKDGLVDAFYDWHMGKTAEYLAQKYNISRERQDKFAAESQRKTKEAIVNGYFEKEIVTVIQEKSRKEINKDEYPKLDLTDQSLAALRPAFDRENGTVTAGNASGINDGAAAVVICSAKVLKSKNLKPLAKIVAFAESGIDPREMGLGPISSVERVLHKANWSKDEVDLYELNEAFAVQSVIVLDKLQIDVNKVNVTGGAISLGHPLACSGTRILTTLLHNLERLGLKKGIAGLCVGGGMGIAIAVERV